MSRKYETPEQISWGLKCPFKAGVVKERQGPGGKYLSYIDARDVMVRLDEVAGPDGWQSRMHDCGGEVVCELSVRYGSQWITKSDGAGQTGIEGEKGQFSDAFKRAAVHHGVGRYLYYDKMSDMTPEQYEARVAFPKKQDSDRDEWLDEYDSK